MLLLRRYFLATFCFFMLSLCLPALPAFAQGGLLYSWGEAYHGDGTIYSERVVPIQLGFPTNVVQASRNNAFFNNCTLVLRADGTVWQWGDIPLLGYSKTRVQLLPEQVVGLTNVIQIASGYNFQAVLKSDGTVWEWGARSTNPVQIGSGVVQIAAGLAHGLALKSDGTVWAWGSNGNGQLGNGNFGGPETFAKVLNLTNVKRIGVGGGTSFAVKSDGTLWVWGSDAISGTYVPTPTKVNGINNVVWVGGGALGTYALTEGGSWWAWGANYEGVFGDGTTNPRPKPTPLLIPDLLEVRTDGNVAIYLKKDGTLWRAGLNIGTTLKQIVGLTKVAHLGDGQALNLAIGGVETPTPVTVTKAVNRSATTEMPVVLEANVTLQAGSIPIMHEAVLFSIDGVLVGGGLTNWAGNAYLQVPNTYTVGKHTIQATYLGSVLNKSSTASATLTILQNDPLARGVINNWGWNSIGKSANDPNRDVNIPILVPGLFNVTYLSTSSIFALALKTDGTVWGWGTNWAWMDGAFFHVDTPMQLPGFTQVVMLANGYQHCVALRSDGTVWTMGSNYLGVLGDGTTIEGRFLPAPIPNFTGVVQIASGIRHSLALKSDGTVWSWGANISGALGNGGTSDSNVPVQVLGLTDVVQIGSYYRHSYALKSDGSLWVWGENGEGQLGDGTTLNRNKPQKVAGIPPIIQASVGDYSTLAITIEGTLWAWGSNKYGQLGDGTTQDSKVPKLIAGISNLAQVAGGTQQSLALKSDGTVWQWGANHPSGITQVPNLTNQTYIGQSTNVGYSFIPVTRITEALIATRTRQYAEPYDLQSIARIAGTSVTLPMKKIDYFVDELNSGSAVTDAGGKTVVPMRRNLPVGTHTIKVRVNGDALYRASISAKNFDVIKANTTLLAITTLARYAETKSLKALFKRNSDKATPSGMKIDFAINGVAVGSANTDSTGTALLPITFGLGVLSLGDHTVTANYAGDSNHNPSSSTGKLTISKALTSITAISTSGKTGATVTLKGVLVRNIGNVPLVGAVLKFSVNGVVVGTSTTSSTGLATFSYKITQGVGSYKIKVEFGGDALHEAVTNEKAILTVN